jgi:two-component system osmolarity sensor histidine kinase EnvZ
MAKLSIKRFLPRTLLGRSLLILITPIVLIQLITMGMFFDRHWNKMTTRLAYAVSGEVAMIVEAAREKAPSRAVAAMSEYSRKHLELKAQYISNGVLPDRSNARRGPIWEAQMSRQLRSELEAQIPEEFVIRTHDDADNIEVYVQVGKGLVKVAFPQRRLFSSSGYIYLMWVMGSSVLLLVVAIVFMRNQIRPIRKLAVAAERFGKGRDTPSFKPEGASEVRQAANAFLDMRRRIQRQISQRTDMLAGVSHDLRTPLTRMKLQLELMPDSPDIRDLKSDVQHMQQMVQGYLDFVRGDGEEQYASVELEELFDRLVAGMKRDQVEVTVELQKGLRLMVRPLAFERALANLLNNAGKYAQHVWIKTFADERKIQIQIDDNGPGIPPEMYEEVFKPFTRVDSSRNIDTGGVGLGLPIAMDIVHAHGGKITLSKSAQGGLCVTVRMPN